MAKEINIQQTFDIIRQLPLEVSFEQVEDWVNSQPKIPVQFLKPVRWSFIQWFFN